MTGTKTQTPCSSPLTNLVVKRFKNLGIECITVSNDSKANDEVARIFKDAHSVEVTMILENAPDPDPTEYKQLQVRSSGGRSCVPCSPPFLTRPLEIPGDLKNELT